MPGLLLEEGRAELGPDSDFQNPTQLLLNLARSVWRGWNLTGGHACLPLLDRRILFVVFPDSFLLRHNSPIRFYAHMAITLY